MTQEERPRQSPRLTTWANQRIEKTHLRASWVTGLDCDTREQGPFSFKEAQLVGNQRRTGNWPSGLSRWCPGFLGLLDVGTESYQSSNIRNGVLLLIMITNYILDISPWLSNKHPIYHGQNKTSDLQCFHPSALPISVIGTIIHT